MYWAIALTRWPEATSASVRCEPMKPSAPVTAASGAEVNCGVPSVGWASRVCAGEVGQACGAGRPSSHERARRQTRHGSAAAQRQGQRRRPAGGGTARPHRRRRAAARQIAADGQAAPNAWSSSAVHRAAASSSRAAGSAPVSRAAGSSGSEVDEQAEAEDAGRAEQERGGGGGGAQRGDRQSAVAVQQPLRRAHADRQHDHRVRLLAPLQEHQHPRGQPEQAVRQGPQQARPGGTVDGPGRRGRSTGRGR